MEKARLPLALHGTLLMIRTTPTIRNVCAALLVPFRVSRRLGVGEIMLLTTRMSCLASSTRSESHYEKGKEAQHAPPPPHPKTLLSTL